MRVAALSSESKPASGREMSLATMMSAPLAAKLLAAAFDWIAALGGKPDQDRPCPAPRAFPSSKRMSVVRTRRRSSGASCFSIFPSAREPQACSPRLRRPSRRCRHPRPPRASPRTSRRRCERARARHRPARRSMSDRTRGRRERPRRAATAATRIPHPPARSIPDVANVVDIFEGRSSADHDEASKQRAGWPENPLGGGRRCRRARRGGPCLSSRRPDSRHPDRRTARLVQRASAMFRRTASCSSMFVFMAGAISTGARVARYNELRKSSAMPCANLPMMLAVAGATRRSLIRSRARCARCRRWRRVRIGR